MDDQFLAVDSEHELATLRAKGKPVLLNAYGEDCQICANEFVKGAIADAYGGRLTLAMLNVDSASDLAEALGIELIPTLLLFGSASLPSRFTEIPDDNGRNVLAWLARELPAVQATRRRARKKRGPDVALKTYGAA